MHKTTSEGKVANGKSVPFIKGLFTIPKTDSEEAHLIGSKCQLCGNVDFPKRDICVECLSDDSMKEILLSNRGKIYAFTIVRWQKLAPEGHKVPYAFGFIDLPEKVRVLTIIDANDLEKLRTGMEVELELIKIDQEEDTNIFGFKFIANV